MTTSSTDLCVAYGDGIGPEIMDATLAVLAAAGARLNLHPVELGEKVYRRGVTSGIPEETWQTLQRIPLLLKAPITTPQGGGVKSLNVTLRKTFGLFANVRPCVAYAPYVPTHHPLMDLVIVRENEEDLYGGIEHQQTPEVVQCLKLISRPGSERVIRYAFEYARLKGRRRVTCLSKDNIMKHTDGLFHGIFDAIAAEYPEIESEHMIVDIGSARVSTQPERFDVIVLPNLYGDILSDIAAELTGSVGLGASANIGERAAMFEAIHGSAPDIAGRGIANPSGLLLASALMLRHIGQSDVAERLQNAWLKTIEDGVHTADLYNSHSQQKVGTDDFAQAVIARIGGTPRKLRPAPTASGPLSAAVKPLRPHQTPEKALVGVDVFLDWRDADRDPKVLGERLAAASADGLSLEMITNRGVQVWPRGLSHTFCTDHWRCRFRRDGEAITHQDVVALLGRIGELGFDFIKTEHLYTFDGKPGYSLGQGQ
ncbi:MAG: NADP-dependent isocitrate dehydrogenase [Myxococcota bacterium]